MQAWRLLPGYNPRRPVSGWPQTSGWQTPVQVMGSSTAVTPYPSYPPLLYVQSCFTLSRSIRCLSSSVRTHTLVHYRTRCSLRESSRYDISVCHRRARTGAADRHTVFDHVGNRIDQCAFGEAAQSRYNNAGGYCSTCRKRSNRSPRRLYRFIENPTTSPRVPRRNRSTPNPSHANVSCPSGRNRTSAPPGR
jgi:hypothetical protein